MRRRSAPDRTGAQWVERHAAAIFLSHSVLAAISSLNAVLRHVAHHRRLSSSLSRASHSAWPGVVDCFWCARRAKRDWDLPRKINPTTLSPTASLQASERPSI